MVRDKIIPEEYKKTEVGIIPNDWEVMKVEDFANCFSGGTPSTSNQHFYGDEIPFIASKELNQRRITKTKKGITKWGLLNSSAKKVEAGTLLVAMYGATAGVSAISKINGAINQAVLAINTDDSTDKKYVFNWFQLNKENIISIYTQGGQPNLSGTLIKQIKIPIPQLSEQTAIANVLSDVDELIENLTQLIEKKKKIKQGAMQELLTGKRRLPGFDGEWEEKKLGDIAEIKKGNLITKKSAIQGNIPVIAGGLKPSYFHNLPNRKPGTITISASGANAGYVSFHPYPIFASDCSTISKSEGYNIKFLYFLLRLKQTEIYELQTGGAQPHVYPENLGKVLVSIPPTKKEQNEIASIVSNLQDGIKSLNELKHKYQLIKQGMMQQLLTGKIRLI
jgi:type I restriction enzyme S subunit